MVRRMFILILLGIFLGACGGCCRKKTQVRVVEQICVHWDENDASVDQVFDDPQKLQLILNKVRTLGQRFSVDTDPEGLDVPVVTMTFCYSDGTQKQYRIKPDRYIQVGQAPWQQANPKQVTSLRLLLLSLPGDSRT